MDVCVDAELACCASEIGLERSLTGQHERDVGELGAQWHQCLEHVDDSLLLHEAGPDTNDGSAGRKSQLRTLGGDVHADVEPRRVHTVGDGHELAARNTLEAVQAIGRVLRYAHHAVHEVRHDVL